jgi:hypothetical protein
MKRFYTLILLITLFFAACSTSRKLTTTARVQDGKSFATAVVVTENHERQGIDAEYAWIKAQYPGYKSRGQALVYHDKKPFDIIHITTSDDLKMDLYFDISNFFGK